MGGGTGAPRSRANERSRLAWRAALREASSCQGAAPSDAVRRWRRGGLSMATSGRSPSSDDGRRRREESGGGGGGGGGRVDGGAGANWSGGAGVNPLQHPNRPRHHQRDGGAAADAIGATSQKVKNNHS